MKSIENLWIKYKEIKMNLLEMNERYEEYSETKDFYLEEGLKYFKLSKKLFRYSNHLFKKAEAFQSKKDYGDLKISDTDIKQVKRHARRAEKLGKELQLIERDFKLKDIKKKEAKQKIKKVKEDNKEFFYDLKKASFVKVLKEIADAGIVMGIIALITGGISPFLLLTPGIKAAYHVKDTI
jgi:hypothetical protein